LSTANIDVSRRDWRGAALASSVDRVDVSSDVAFAAMVDENAFALRIPFTKKKKKV